MASNSKSTELTAPASSRYKYTLSSYFNETGTNNEGNYSSIYCSATLSASQISFNSTNGGTLYIYWHDDRENYDRLVASEDISSCGMGYGSRTVSGTINVTHKDDGTLNGYAYAYFTKNNSVSYIPASGGVATDWTQLTSIQRKAIITSASNFNDEGSPTITYSNPVGYRINARLEFAGSYIHRENIANTGSYTFELTSEERTLLRQKCTGKTMTVRYVIGTCITGTTETQWSVQDKEMSIINATPTKSSFDVIDINTTTTAITGDNTKFIKSASNAKISFNFSTLKYATLSVMKINGVTIENITPESSSEGTTNYEVEYTINGINTSNIDIYIKDSRGYEYTETKTIDLIDYIPVSANATANRKQPTTGEIETKFNGNYFNSILGNTSNTLTIKYKYKKVEEQSYSNYITLVENTDYTIDNSTFYSGTYSSEYPITLSPNFDYRYDYEIVIEFSDLLTTASKTITVIKGIPIIQWNKTKFQVNGDLYVADNNGNNAVNVMSKIEQNTLDVITRTINLGTFYSTFDKYDQTSTVSIPSGYEAVGIIGYSLSGAYFTWVMLSRLYIDGTTVYWSAGNPTPHNTGDINCTLKILVRKTT